MTEGVRIHYQEELEKLEARALEGLDMVAAQLERATEAVEQRDTELAELVVASDDVKTAEWHVYAFNQRFDPQRGAVGTFEHWGTIQGDPKLPKT